MANVLRLIAALLFFHCSSSWAIFTPSGWQIQSRTFDTVSDACEWAYNVYPKDPGYVYYKKAPSYNPSGTQLYCNIGWAPKSQPGTEWASDRTTFNKIALQCPANSTAGTGGCTCNAGFSEKLTNGVYSCWADDEATCSSNAMRWNSTLNDDRFGRVAGNYSDYVDGAVTCRDNGLPSGKGCKMWFTGDLGFTDKDGKSWVNGSQIGVSEMDLKDPKFGGSLLCNLTENPTPQEQTQVKQPDKSCRNGYKGSVNGVEVCIEAWTGQTQGVDFGITKGPDGTSTSTKTEIKCNGDQCTVTETNTIKDSNGNTTGTNTTVTQGVNRGQYCANNPKSTVCGGSRDDSGGSKGQDGDGNSGGGGGGGGGDGESGKEWGGSCSGFTCSGDAIQCAIALEQHKRNCEMDALRDTQAYKLALQKADYSDKPGSVTGDLEGNREQDISVSGGDSFLGGAGGGAQDATFDLGDLGTLSIPFSQLNYVLAMMGHVIVILAGLTGVGIIVKKV